MLKAILGILALIVTFSAGSAYAGGACCTLSGGASKGKAASASEDKAASVSAEQASAGDEAVSGTTEAEEMPLDESADE